MTTELKMSVRSVSSMERRRFIRVVQSCPLTFVTSKGVSGEGDLADISLRGMRIMTDETLAPGEKIRSVFILSNGISMDLEGIVRHRQGKKEKAVYGIEFSIKDYRDLKEHLKLNSFIVHARAEQDRMLRKELAKKRGL